MADRPDNPSAQADEAGRRKRFSPRLLAIVGAVAVLQSAGFFVVFKVFGSHPEAAHGEHNPAIAGANASAGTKMAEVVVLKSFKVPNDQTGVLRIYDLDLSVVVPADQVRRMESLLEERSGEIGDRVARILRGATDEMLRENDLRVLKAQVQRALEELTRDKTLVQRVLIPRLMPIRAE